MESYNRDLIIEFLADHIAMEIKEGLVDEDEVFKYGELGLDAYSNEELQDEYKRITTRKIIINL